LLTKTADWEETLEANWAVLATLDLKSPKVQLGIYNHLIFETLLGKPDFPSGRVSIPLPLEAVPPPFIPWEVYDLPFAFPRDPRIPRDPRVRPAQTASEAFEKQSRKRDRSHFESLAAAERAHQRKHVRLGKRLCTAAA
jgi:hypothetical protein